jgi:PAS domain S-box-containing protein
MMMRKLSSALEGIADAVVITDRDGRIEFVNAAFEEVTGYSRDEALGKNPSLLHSGQHDREFFQELWQTILQDRVFRAKFINRRKDGSLYYEEKTITPLTDANGVITHFVSTGRDVTLQHHEAEHLRQQQAELEHNARVSAMGEVASSLVHELSQPLTGITNYVQGCLRLLRSGTTDARDLREALENIDLFARQSGEIIGQLRGLIRKSGARRRPCAVNPLMQEAAKLANIEARQHRVRLTLELAEDLPLVRVDATQIKQVVVNLVHNAVEAIAVVAAVERWVKVRTALGADGKVGVTVWDSGPGLPPEDVGHLFEPFFSTKPDSLGLGLAICRSIVEAHGSKLCARLHPAGGAVFQFSLDVTRREALP